MTFIGWETKIHKGYFYVFFSLSPALPGAPYGEFALAVVCWLPRQVPRGPPLTQSWVRPQWGKLALPCSSSHCHHFCALVCPACFNLFVSSIIIIIIFCSSFSFKTQLTVCGSVGLGHQLILFCFPFPFCQIQEKTYHKELEDSSSQPFESSWPLIS